MNLKEAVAEMSVEDKLAAFEIMVSNEDWAVELVELVGVGSAQVVCSEDWAEELVELVG